MEAVAIKKGSWTTEEDEKLKLCIEKHGPKSWNKVPQSAGLNRTGKSCRERWSNYLRPGIKRGNFSAEEELQIIHLHSTHGNRWSKITRELEGRTDNEIRNYCNKYLRKERHHQGNGGPQALPSSSVAADDERHEDWINELMIDSDAIMDFHSGIDGV